ncbi:MAG: DUF2490 domain-containing protein [Methylococcales bacterium]
MGFGKQGFTENRILAGLRYQFTKQVGMDPGYLGQYVDNPSGNNLLTHNLQANLRFRFWTAPRGRFLIARLPVQSSDSLMPIQPARGEPGLTKRGLSKEAPSTSSAWP